MARDPNAVARCVFSLLGSGGVEQRPRPRKHRAVKASHPIRPRERAGLLLSLEAVHANGRIYRGGALSPARHGPESKTERVLPSIRHHSLPPKTMASGVVIIPTSIGNRRWRE